MEILVNVTGQRLKAATNLSGIVAGTKNFVRFVFELGPGWSGLQVFAQFQQGGKTYELLLDDRNSACLPPEIEAGICTLTIYGSNGDVTGTTNSLILTIGENNLVKDVITTDLTPSLYDQLAQKINLIGSAVGVPDNLIRFVTSVTKQENGVLIAYSDGSEELIELSGGSSTPPLR